MSESSNKLDKSFVMHKTLNHDLWGDDDVLIDGIRRQLIMTTKIYLEYLDIQEINCHNLKTTNCIIDDVILTGSIANYNYSKYSDIDIHIVLNYESVNDNTILVEEFFKAKEKLWKLTHDVKIKGYDVEIFMQDSEKKLFADGQYSILDNEWLVKSSKSDFKPNIELIKEKAQKWMRMVDTIYDMDDTDLAIYSFKILKKKLSKYRNIGLNKEGEKSIENMVFKYLRRNGYLAKLMSLKNRLIDYKLSLV